MPKAFGKEVPTWMLIAVGGLTLLLAYNRFLGGDEPPTTSAKKTPKKTTAASDLFTKEDYTAKFASFTEAPKNAFQPILTNSAVAKNGEVGGLAGSITGGEANWFYTGSIEINGRAQALLENTTTGESVYLAKGEKFKKTDSTLEDITPEHVVFSGPTGKVVAKLNDPTELKHGANVGTRGGLAPMSPGSAMVGPIGGGMAGTLPGAIDPNTGQPMMTPFNGMSAQPDQSQNGFGRGRGRGGRGRGGNRGGGNGFGGFGN